MHSNITNKKPESVAKAYSTGEEIFNSISHGVGTLLAIAALVVLVVRSCNVATDNTIGYCIAGTTAFASSMIVLYLMSTLYHGLTPQTAKKVFAIFDHTSIYLLIAGTYTPYCLITLRGKLGWTMFGIIWGLAIIGITFYAIFGKRIRRISVVTYVLMGWMIMFVAKPMYAVLSPKSFAFLVAGGIAYTIGAVFYALKKIKWMHCVWHIFVIAGSVFHFFSVYYAL